MARATWTGHRSARLILNAIRIFRAPMMHAPAEDAAQARPSPARSRILESSAPAILEQPAIRAHGRGFVEVHRDIETFPNLFSRSPGDSDAIGQRGAFERYERNHVRRAHSRMNARVLAQIDALHRHRDASQRAFRHRIRRTGERDDAAVVIGIHFRPQHQHAGRRCDSVFDRVHDSCVSPLGKISDAFY